MNQNRLHVVDTAKGIGIILVVFAHVYYGSAFLTFVYSFHMPLFFILSGLLFRQEKYPRFSTFFLQRAKRLLVPYVIYETVSIACLFLAERAYGSIFDVSRAEYLEYFRQILFSTWSGAHVNQPLWFLPSLFLVEMLYWWLCTAAKGKQTPVVLVCFLAACCGWVLESGILNFDNMLLPWNLDSALFALGFYAFGNLFSEPIRNAIGKTEASRYRVLICLAVILILTCIWAPLAQLNGKITLGTKILNNGFLLYATGITGTLMVLAGSILLKNCPFLSFCGRHSFEIMASHYLIRKCLVRPVYILLNGEAYKRKQLREAFLPFLIVFALSLLFTFVYHQIRSRCSKKAAV